MSAIKSNYSCAPPFLILGGDHRLVCNDNGNRTLVFILTNKKAVRVDITPQDPPLILNETISSLQSQCEPGEDNVTFKCKNGIKAAVRDSGFGLTINLCLQGLCWNLNSVMASGPLTYLLGCGVASYHSYQVCYLWHRMVLTKAAGDAELANESEWDGHRSLFGCLKIDSYRFFVVFRITIHSFWG